MKNHETHNEYILDVLEDEQIRLTEEIKNSISPELEYTFNKLIEVIIEKVEMYNKIAN
jgi:hypothetical protein